MDTISENFLVNYNLYSVFKNHLICNQILSFYEKDFTVFSELSFKSCSSQSRLTNLDIISTKRLYKQLDVDDSVVEISFKEHNKTTDKTSKKQLVNSILFEVKDHNRVKKSHKNYKLRLFQNGQVLLPGIISETLDDAKYCIHKVVDSINRHSTINTKCESIYSSVRNYRCHVIGMDENIKINTNKLKKCLLKSKLKDDDFTEFVYPNIYICENNEKITIKINTPRCFYDLENNLNHKQKNKYHVNIIINPSGKIQIDNLEDITTAIFIYHWVLYMFKTFKGEIMIHYKPVSDKECKECGIYRECDACNKFDDEYSEEFL